MKKCFFLFLLLLVMCASAFALLSDVDFIFAGYISQFDLVEKEVAEKYVPVSDKSVLFSNYLEMEIDNSDWSLSEDTSLVFMSIEKLGFVEGEKTEGHEKSDSIINSRVEHYSFSDSSYIDLVDTEFGIDCISSFDVSEEDFEGFKRYVVEKYSDLSFDLLFFDEKHLSLLLSAELKKTISFWELSKLIVSEVAKYSYDLMVALSQNEESYNTIVGSAEDRLETSIESEYPTISPSNTENYGTSGAIGESLGFAIETSGNSEKTSDSSISAQNNNSDKESMDYYGQPQISPNPTDNYGSSGAIGESLGFVIDTSGNSEETSDSSISVTNKNSEKVKVSSDASNMVSANEKRIRKMKFEVFILPSIGTFKDELFFNDTTALGFGFGFGIRDLIRLGDKVAISIKGGMTAYFSMLGSIDLKISNSRIYGGVGFCPQGGAFTFGALYTTKKGFEFGVDVTSNRYEYGLFTNYSLLIGKTF